MKSGGYLSLADSILGRRRRCVDLKITEPQAVDLRVPCSVDHRLRCGVGPLQPAATGAQRISPFIPSESEQVRVFQADKNRGHYNKGATCFADPSGTVGFAISEVEK